MPRALPALALALLVPLALPAASATGLPPAADLWVDRSTGIPETGDGLGTEFHFAAGGTSDPDTVMGDLWARWDWEGDGAWDTPWDDYLAGRHAYTAPGTYLPCVEVQDPQGNADTACVGPLLVEAPRTLSVGAPAEGDLAERLHRHDYTLTLPEGHLDVELVLDWPSKAGNNLDLYFRKDARPDPLSCSPTACYPATSQQTGGPERLCVRFTEAGTYHVAVLARSLGSPIHYSLVANTDVVGVQTAQCLAFGQLPSAAFLTGPLPVG